MGGCRTRHAGAEAGASRRAAALLLPACLALGCGGAKPGRRPEATFRALREAMLEKNYEALWDLLSARTRERKIAGVKDLQRQVEAKLDNMTALDKRAFLKRQRVTPEEFVNMSPAEFFAMGVRADPRLAEGLAQALAEATLAGVLVEGDVATLEILVGTGSGGRAEKVTLALEREHGLYRVRSFDQLLTTFRPAERARRPGTTPRRTFEALQACIRDGAYGDLWKLVSSAAKEQLLGPTEELKKQYAELPASERRSLERDLGVTVEEFAGMSEEEVFEVQMRFKMQAQRRRGAILNREFVSAEIEGERATVLARGPAGEARISMVLEGGVWLVEGF